MKISDQVIFVNLSDLHVDHNFNCRTKINPEDVADLARMIARDGLQSPILIRTCDPDTHEGKHWSVIAGFRRTVAHQVLQAETIKAFEVTEINDFEARYMNLTENTGREDLSFMEVARAIKPLIDMGATEEEIARRLNKSRTYVQVRKLILAMPPEVQEAADAGLINQAQIRGLDQLATPEEQKQFLAKIKVHAASGKKTCLHVKEATTVKRARDRGDMGKCLDHIYDSFETEASEQIRLTTKALAWCRGELTDDELYAAMEDFAEKQGIPYFKPEHAISEFDKFI